MNWKFIFQLSMLGFIMAFGTISLIPEKVEFLFWLAIFLICGYMIAKVCTARYFLYGFWLSMVNSVYITVAHALFYHSYIAHHPGIAKMNVNMPGHPILLMIVSGPLFGASFGLIQGLFAFVASKMVKNKVESISDPLSRYKE